MKKISARKKKAIIVASITVLTTLLLYFISLSIVKPVPFNVGGKLFDKFGIMEVYPTKTGGREWFINMENPTSDDIFNPRSNISKQNDNSWQISGRPNTGKYNNEIRMEVNTLEGQQPWKNVEITGYAKVIFANPPFDSIVWYARGGKHDSLVPV